MKNFTKLNFKQQEKLYSVFKSGSVLYRSSGGNMDKIILKIAGSDNKLKDAKF